MAGAVDGDEDGMFCPKPGKKNVAGETLGEAEKPPQPVKANKASGSEASQSRFQNNLTGLVYARWACSQ